ncbi:hypothetical protein FQU96_13825 [Reyranella sp. CPCC 100927]|nr:hypothetical protein FQU96_13825 [Reyranella sp. CPCC 100927]
MNRRAMIGAGLASILANCARKDPMAERLWRQWQADWRWMEAIARRRGWTLTPLRMAPPATDADIARIEARHGLKCPPQLRTLLTQYSAHVAFGWHIPGHLQAMEKREMPTMSANRNALWDLAHMDTHAIPNFFNWKCDLAQRDISEAPNRPQMWENQFPFYDLVNGDMLTIDMSRAEGPHPVRYFSHELEMLHGLALAPDFFSFVTEMSKLGFAGTEWASWLRFGRQVDDTYYLRADSDGGKAWRAWLERDPNAGERDEPPPSIVETTAADHALLTAARANQLTGVNAALAAGAKVDAVWNQQSLLDMALWSDEFCTAVTYATRHDNITMLETLVRRGATLNTRRLPLGEAVEFSALQTVTWLIARGARANGWKDQRFWPLHLLVTRRAEVAARTKAEYERHLREQGWPQEPAEIAALVARHIDVPTYKAMLGAVLEAGADPDARWDNGITMLMWDGVETARLLLKHGADIHARDAHGWTVLHRARTAELVHLFAAQGADVNAIAQRSPGDADDLAYTPLQGALLAPRGGTLDVAKALLDVGADPKVRDADGRSTLCYCTTREGFELIKAYGLDPLERTPDGGTLLHNLLRMTSIRASFANEVACLDSLLEQGLDINATDASGRTMLHIAAERIETPADVQLLLDRGADKTVKDTAGKRPVDLVPRSLKDVRALLR